MNAGAPHPGSTVSGPGQSELIDAIARGSADARGPVEVELVQTHLSLVVLAGDRAYKFKKALDLGFVDYTTLDRRRRFCEEEVRLNRRLAPGVYVGVVPITRERDGSLRIDGSGEVVEYAVEMRRLPAGRMLDRLLEAGEIDNQQMDELAQLLAGFHEAAATGGGVDEYGTWDAVAFNVHENFDETAPFVGPAGEGAPAGPRTLSPMLHRFLSDAADRFLDRERALIDKRVRERRIRDGHGDLHAGNVCLADSGIIVYDCIEFAPRLRCGDVACDLAFLAMDLDYRGFRGFSRYFVKRYGEHAGDAELGSLITFYKGYRAIVRAKVASIAAADLGLGAEDRERRRLDAFRYFHLAASYELPAVLIVTCGLPASGKSTAAKHLAAPFEAVTLRSDARRKLLAGLPPTRRAGADYGSGIYTPQITELTYESLLAGARAALLDRRSVVVDASFARQAQRAPFAELARELTTPFVLVETTAPEATIRARMRARDRDPSSVSDADLTVYRLMQQAYEPPRELPAAQVLTAGEGEPGEETTARALDRIIEQSKKRSEPI